MNFRTPRRRRSAEASLDAERRDHLRRQIDDYLAAGLPPDEARQAARVDPMVVLRDG